MSDLKSFVERYENIDDQIRSFNDDKRDLYQEIKSSGFDVKAFKAVAVRRLKDPDELENLQSLIDLYESELAQLPPREPRRRERLPRDAFQPVRKIPAGFTESRAAHRNKTPVSFDTTYGNGRVYFAHCKTTGRLKIGISNNVEDRLANIAKSSGLILDLIATFAGNRQEELRAHEAFVKWKLTGEWFSYTEECQKAVAAYLDNSPEVDHARAPAQDEAALARAPARSREAA